MSVPDVSLIIPETVANPFPVWAQVRAEAPVFRSPELGMVVVSRYDDLVHVLKDTETFSSRWGEQGPRRAAPAGAVAEILESGYPDAEVLTWADGAQHNFHADLMRPS
jgi:cytochrome P450